MKLNKIRQQQKLDLFPVAETGSNGLPMGVLSDGTTLGGVHKINALLACVGVRGLTPTQVPLENTTLMQKVALERIASLCQKLRVNVLSCIEMCD